MKQEHLHDLGRTFDTQQQALTDAFEVAILRNKAEQAVTENFVIVNYSQKALAVFGDTRPIKKQLRDLGGLFNPKLTHEGQKKAGWIFHKSKEQEVRDFLTVK